MRIVKIENNKIYSTSTLCEKTDIFEIVEKIPVGFFVWNIGENMGTHEYIPVCEDLHPEDKDNYEINTATLKAVKVAPDEWEKLNKAASWGVGNLKQAEKALKSKRHGYTSERKRAAAELTIEIFRRICEQPKRSDFGASAVGWSPGSDDGGPENEREVLNMEKLKRLQKKLSGCGYDAELITVYNRNGEDVPALRINTDYEGQYPTKETHTKINEIRKLCKNHVTECRGFYTAVFIY